MADTANVRFVTVRGVRYLRAEDVASYLREVAGSEPTDTRERLQAAAARLSAETPPASMQGAS
jgi:hypothetical protein